LNGRRVPEAEFPETSLERGVELQRGEGQWVYVTLTCSARGPLGP
jgi:hypothetical protein